MNSSNNSGKSQYLAFYSPKRTNTSEQVAMREKSNTQKAASSFKTSKSPSIPTEVSKNPGGKISVNSYVNGIFSSAKKSKENEKLQNRTLDYKAHLEGEMFSTGDRKNQSPSSAFNKVDDSGCYKKFNSQTFQ